MSLLKTFLDFFLHLDVHLASIIQQFGAGTYALLFLVIFCETGLVVTPILPGDSLIFAAGAFAQRGWLNLWLLWIVLCAAAVLGDTVNYWIGHALGPKLFDGWCGKFLKKEYCDRTQTFYDRHGAKTIVLARFVPIIRTFAPFVAGIGKMHYGKFISYNVVGGIAWVSVFLFGGYYFGNIPSVRENFTLVLLAIVIVSVMPPLVEWIRTKADKRKVS